jgi:hypothetical protein
MSTMDERTATTLLTHALVERRAHEDPWHELAIGALTREQVVAMRRGLESPEELERKLALFEPPTPEQSDRILQALLARPGSPASKPSADQPGTHEPRSDEDDSVVPLRTAERSTTRRAGSTTTVVGVLLAAAAVLLVWLVRPAPDPEAPATPERLPAFELQLQGGWSGDMRGTDTADPATDGCDQRYHRERSLSVRLHPSEAFGDELSVATHAQPETGEGHWIPSHVLAPRLSSEGVLSIEQPIAELGLGVGAWTLTFYVVRDEARLDLAALRGLEPGSHPGVTVVRGRICIVE